MTFQPEKNVNTESKGDPEKETKEGKLPYQVKKSLSLKVVFGILLLCLAVGIALAFIGGDEEKLQIIGLVLLVPGGITLVLYFLLNRYTLTIKEDEIVHSSPGSSKEISIFEIKEIKIEGVALTIYGKEKFSKNPISIGLGVLGKDEYKLFFETILKQNPEVELNDPAKRVKGGHYEEITKRARRLAIGYILIRWGRDLFK